MNEKSNPGRTGLALVFWVNMKWPFLHEVFLSIVLYFFSYDTYLVAQLFCTIRNFPQAMVIVTFQLVEQVDQCLFCIRPRWVLSVLEFIRK